MPPSNRAGIWPGTRHCSWPLHLRSSKCTAFSMRRFPVFLMVVARLVGRLEDAEPLCRSTATSRAMNGRAVQAACSSRVARISSALRTSDPVSRTRPSERLLRETDSPVRMANLTDGFGRIQRGVPGVFLHYTAMMPAPERPALPIGLGRLAASKRSGTWFFRRLQPKYPTAQLATGNTRATWRKKPRDCLPATLTSTP